MVDAPTIFQVRLTDTARSDLDSRRVLRSGHAPTIVNNEVEAHTNSEDHGHHTIDWPRCGLLMDEAMHVISCVTEILHR
jgi:hypothetical protein